MRAGARRGIEQRLVEQETRQAGAAKRQLQPFVPAADFKAEPTGRPRAELPHIEPEPGHQRLRFSAQKFAADLVMGAGGFFQNDDGTALARQRNGKSRAGQAAADHNRFAHRETCSF